MAKRTSRGRRWITIPTVRGRLYVFVTGLCLVANVPETSALPFSSDIGPSVASKAADVDNVTDVSDVIQVHHAVDAHAVTGIDELNTKNLSSESQGLDASGFEYHKPVLPLDLGHDGLTIALAVIGLLIAASGGIGGGGILVPLFMLVLGFRPKHAIALSNFTILGGSIANTMVNCRKRHPTVDKPLIDWDLILIMEPLTIFGAIFGSLMGKVLPNLCLTLSLVLVLSYMGQRTLRKGLAMWRKESDRRVVRPADHELELRETFDLKTGTFQASSCDGEEVVYREMESDVEVLAPNRNDFFLMRPTSVRCKVLSLVLCFIGMCVLTILKGGGSFKSPLGFPCGSLGFWGLYFGAVPWVLVFAFAFRSLLVREFKSKVLSGHVFAEGEVKWNSKNTLKYPALCAISGLLAGLFGVGGGIVKGPLMLEMGVIPSVAAASAAAMILFTSAAASTSFLVFGLLHFGYGILFFVVGFVSTVGGQYIVGLLVEKHQRQSPIVISIGSVICLSALMVFIQDVVSFSSGNVSELIRPHNVCTVES